MINLKLNFHRLVALLILTLFPLIFLAGEDVVPRVVIALYDSHYQDKTQLLNVHQLAEMPLNHLGVKVEYADIRKGLPELAERQDVVGVLTWFPYSGVAVDPIKYINWSIDVLSMGKKYVIIGNSAFDSKDGVTPSHIKNRFWERFGLFDTDQITNMTDQVNFVYLDPRMMNFERTYAGIKPEYKIKRSISPNNTLHALACINNDPTNEAVVVMTNSQGGYIAENYAAYKPLPSPGISDIRKWFVNPFAFFRIAFDTDRIPKPDTTTLAGRRIYYSHIDGDGWNNVSDIERYRSQHVLSAWVIYNDIMLRYLDLPVTVAPIAADIDLDWVGTQRSREVAAMMFQLPHVEMGTHTYTHPFDWGFFAHYSESKEIPYLRRYPTGNWKDKGMIRMVVNALEGLRKEKGTDQDISSSNDEAAINTDEKLKPGYVVPRAYALEPFNIDLEIFGSIDKIQQLAPPGKKINVLQWSGDCYPFETAIRLSREAGVRNINGGDTRFDREYLSYCWVKPIGRKVIDQQQIYSSNSNENTYTDMWSQRFYAFDMLPETFKNTETPLRIKPMNIYYHMYSGEKMPSLKAVNSNLEYVRKQEIIPISASHFAAIADGYFTTQILLISPGIWKIENRGKLQTIRFDYSTFSGVDFTKSQGVIGQRHFQGSLYVYLDEAVSAPVIALKEIAAADTEPIEDTSYLIESRWYVYNVKRFSPDKVSIATQGFGSGTMSWRVPSPGNYLITMLRENKEINTFDVSVEDGTLTIPITQSAITPLTLIFEKKP